LIFTETKLPGAFVIEPEKHEDDRGFFARSFCREEFEAHGLNPNVAQCNISFNKRKGTLRGMHYQTAPFAEAKLVRCTAGSIYDVIIDLRSSSRTFKEHFATELSAANRRALYIPEEFAHGFQTLEDNTEVFYQMSQLYSAKQACGVRWDDPAFGIQWPQAQRIMNERDRNYPDFCGVRTN
jgi:dTDP-4-dehydrorhamnose 3,5-epimerase